MNLYDILKNIHYKKILNIQDITINNIVIDTKKIKEGDIFIGIKGERIDGNNLFLDALKKGASAVIVDHLDNNNLKDYLIINKKTIIIVDDTIKTLGSLAKYKRSLFTGKLIAITGSAGKTSTKDMIYSILNDKYKVYKTKGNLNNHIGLPLCILEADLDNNFIILEMGMNHLKEISYLSKLVTPDIAVITNVGTSHIGNLGNRKNILKAKLEILEGLNDNGLLIINNDNDLLHSWYLNNKDVINIKTIGIYNESDYQAKNISFKEDKSKFKIQENEIIVSVGGEHFIYNALIGYALGSIFNMTSTEINKGITNLNLSNNRMNIIKNSKGFKIIDDCYNSNYDSCKYSIKFLSGFSGRKIAVLGTMLELGKYSKYYHKKLGDIIIEEEIDIIITVGKYSDLINKRAIELGFDKNNSYHLEDNNDAINLINKIKTNNDIILIKASHSLNFNEIVLGVNN